MTAALVDQKLDVIVSMQFKLETGKEPGERLFATHSTVFGSSTTPQRKNTCPPLLLGIVAREPQALARLILFAREVFPAPVKVKHLSAPT